MPADLSAAGAGLPRRARYLIPRDLPRRAEILAALAVLGIVAHLLLAPAALAAAALFHAIGKVSRWRPYWLLVPAGAGLAWILAAGPAAALAGASAAPRALAGLATGLITEPGRLTRPGAATAALRWLPGQLPAALVVAAAEAAIAWWLGWLHTDDWDRPAARPGLVVLARRRANAALAAAGGVLTRDGTCLGVDGQTGRLAAVSWAEAAGGVLACGASWAEVSATGFQFVHAAIRRRKPVIAVDLAGDPAFAAAVTAACAAAGAPLHVFGVSGPARYEPLQGGSPARKASLITGMIDWSGRPEAAQRNCAAVLADIAAVAAAAPAGAGQPVLDDVIGLLDPAALRARLAQVPPYHPRRAALAERARAAAARLEADPEPAALVTAQLTALRSSALGRWLGPPPAGRQPGPRITVTGVARERGVALFSLGHAAPGGPAEMIASLVALDAAGVFADLARAGAAADGLAWFGRCEAVSPAALAALLATGPQAGLACVLATISPQTAGTLAGQARVLAVHRLADPGLARLIAPLTGVRLTRAAGPAAPAGQPAAGAGAWPPAAAPAGAPSAGGASGLAWQPVAGEQTLCGRPAGEFTLIVGAPQSRVSAHARLVPGRIPDPRPVRPARLARLAARATRGGRQP